MGSGRAIVGCWDGIRNDGQGLCGAGNGSWGARKIHGILGGFMGVLRGGYKILDSV